MMVGMIIYNYNISFMWDDGATRFGSVIFKMYTKQITEAIILEIKNNNDIPKDAVVLAVSYLGEY